MVAGHFGPNRLKRRYNSCHFALHGKVQIPNRDTAGQISHRTAHKKHRRSPSAGSFANSFHRAPLRRR